MKAQISQGMRGTTIGAPDDLAAEQSKFDPAIQKLEIQKAELIGEIKSLEEQKIKLDHDYERLEFKLNQAETAKISNF